jgi:hypothetical protein
MQAEELIAVTDEFKANPEYREARRNFHERYEWLEGYWRQCPGIGNLDKFCQRFGDYYWNLEKLRESAWELAGQGCVGKSTDEYRPSDEVIKATMFLLHRAEIKPGKDEVPGCDAMDCHKTRHGLELCNAQQRAGDWDHSGFKAVMYIVRQIRNNFSHGRKLEVESRQYERNRQLISIAQQIMDSLIEHLVEAEIQHESATRGQQP